MDRDSVALDDARHAAELLELGDAFFELDRDWRIVRVNRNQEKLSGKPRAETLGRSFWEVWPELANDQTRYWREYRRCMTERVPVQFRDYYAALDLWTGVTAYPVSTGGIAVFFRDITPIKRAEREQRRLASIVESTDDAIISKSLDGVVLSWNAGAERLFGWAASEIVGRSIGVLLPPERSGEEDRILAELCAGRRVDAFDTVRVRKDGSRVPVSVTVSPLRDEDGAIVGASKIARDITERKRAGDALRASEERFRSVLQNMSEGVMLFDVDGNLVYQNPASLRIHGFEPEGDGRIERDRLPVTWKAWDGGGRPIAFDEWPVSRVFRRERFQNQVLRVERVETGRVFYGSYNGAPILDADGRLVLGFITIRDITEQRRAEDAVRAEAHAADDERRRLAAVLEALPAGVAIADRHGAFTHVNAEFRRIWGSPPSPRSIEEYGAWRGWWQDGRPISAEDWALPRAVRTGDAIVPGDVVDIEKFDGSGRATIVNAAAPIRNADGEIVGGAVAEVDITVQRRAEAAARDAEQRMRSVLENLPSGVIVADLSTGDLHWNAEALRIHGYTGEGDQHKFVESLVAEHDLRALDGAPVPVPRWPLPRLLARESFRDYELLVRNTRLGWDRVFSYSGVIVALDGAPAIGLLAIRDVSARSRAEAALRAANDQLRDADRRKDEFLGMLSHELRNPLAPIRNSLYILDHAEPTGEQARRAKDIASRQLAHLTRLVDDLLDMTRIARGKVELRRTSLDLAALARRTAEDYRPLMHERELELAVDVPALPVLVDGDDTRLAQVLGNLLSNAAKFTPAGGRVTLEVRRSGARVAVHVRDTGVGIAPDLLLTIFDPFTQAEQTLARSEGGLGLGLALVKGLTELHGGRVAVTSVPGSGTEFRVELPAADAADPVDRAEEVRPVGRTQRVLVVDDNVDAAESLADLVRLLGHDAEVAHDGPSAVASVETRRPDVVLCDLGLPGMDGYEVAKVLRAKLDDGVRLVAVSGYAQPEDVKRSEEAGFDGHIAKPPDPGRLERLFA